MKSGRYKNPTSTEIRYKEFQVYKDSGYTEKSKH